MDTLSVVLTGTLTGTRNGVEWPPRGSVMELPVDEAASLIKGGMARPVVVDDPVETAVADVTEVESRPLTTGTGPGRRKPTRGA